MSVREAIAARYAAHVAAHGSAPMEIAVSPEALVQYAAELVPGGRPYVTTPGDYLWYRNARVVMLRGEDDAR